MTEQPDRSEADDFDGIVEAETNLPQDLEAARSGDAPTPDLAVIAAGSRTRLPRSRTP
ncbi:hypothetical protein [Streptomyces xanthochromogenes]